MDEWQDDHNSCSKLWWTMRTFQTYPDLFACWCGVDDDGIPAALGFFDQDFGGRLSIYDNRHVALIAAPTVTLEDLPVSRDVLKDVGWPSTYGQCLTLEHFTGMDLTFHHHPDGSGCVHLSAHIDWVDGSLCQLHLPYSVITEYLACLTCDPTRWHERPGWVRSPRPHDARVDVPLKRIEDVNEEMARGRREEARWFASVQDELFQRIIATF
jgi:hypothetical protein